MKILFALIAAHFLCDYPLQGDFIGKFKNRHVSMDKAFNATSPIPWWHLMTAHAFIHAGAVLLITGNLYFATFELFAHFLIDVLKCEGQTDINVDQILHIVCKVLYVGWVPLK